DRTALPLRAQLLDHLVQRFVQRHLREILPVITRGDRAANLELAVLKRMLAEQRAQQRGLAGSVAADESHDVGSLQRSAEPLHQRALADGDTDVLSRHDLIAAPFTHLEPQRHRPFGRNDRTEPWQPVEPFAPALGLFGVLPRNVAGDVIALFGNDALLLLERALLRQPAL